MSPHVILLAVIAAAGLVVPPLVGWPPVVRLPAIVIPPLVAIIAMARPWRWDATQFRAIEQWEPSRTSLAVGAAVIALVLYWIVLTRFESTSVNAVDFTVYFDRPCYQTVHGRPLYVETADVPSFSHRTQLAVHSYWVMFPVCSVYWLYPSPQWLLALSVVAVVAGSIHVARIARMLGANGALSVAAALAYVLNDNTARALNYGFHVEVLYAWFVPWLIDAALRGAVWSAAGAALACISVKEDAVMPLIGVAVVVACFGKTKTNRMRHTLLIVLPPAVALLNLAVYYGYIMPALLGSDRPTYATFWYNYGATPLAALRGMLSNPGRVLADTSTSGIFTNVLPPHLWLPLLSWRWMAGVMPIVMLYGASANEQLRSFGIYYAIVLVPFLVPASALAARAVTRRVGKLPCPQTVAGLLIVIGALLVGSTRAGYSLRPWRAEVSALPALLERLAGEPTLLVQSGLYPHAGYAGRVRLLTPETLAAARATAGVVVIAPDISAYPFAPAEMVEIARLHTVIDRDPTGILALRLVAAR